MIFTERTIKISKDTCEIDKPIVLYRGDYNVEVRFTIIESPFKYTTKNSTNIIEDVKASYGQLVIKTPNEKPAIFTDVVETNEGSVVFTLSGEMIDETIEVGDYTFQIRLFDSNRGSRATIPPIENGISIREPIAIEDVSSTNEVDAATVGYALTTAGISEDAFDGEGNYNKTTWTTGDRITAAKLNKMEVAIDGVNKKVASGSASGEGMTQEQVSQLFTAYQHSQSTHAPSNAEANVQADWNETNTTSDAYIKNKPTNLATTDDIPTVPTKTSQLTNDSDFVNSTYVNNKIAEASLSGGEVDLSGYVTKGVGNASQIQFADGQTFQAKLDAGTLKGDKGDKGDTGATGANGQDGLTTAISVNGTTYTHSDGTIALPNYPTVPTNVSAFTNDANYASQTFVTNKIAEAQLGGGAGGTGTDIPVGTRPWANYKWACIGDSLTDSTINANTKYHQIIANETGIIVQELAKGGTGYTAGYDSSSTFYDRIANIAEDTDIVTLFGSVNDWKNNEHNTLCHVIGTVNDVYDDSQTVIQNTFCANLNKTFDALYAKVPTAQVIVFGAMPYYGVNDTCFDNVREALINVCAKRHIPFVDMFDATGFYRIMDNATYAAAYTTDFTGTNYETEKSFGHPNNEAHRKIIAPKFYAKLKEYLPITHAAQTGGGTTPVLCTGVSLDANSLTFETNATQTLHATFTPSNTTESKVWSSNNPSIATVANGVVTPVANGSCNITITCGNFSATCSVTVNMTEQPGSGGDSGSTPDFVNYAYNTDTYTNPTTTELAQKNGYYFMYKMDKSVSDGVLTMTKKPGLAENVDSYALFRMGIADNNTYYCRALVRTASQGVKAGINGSTEPVPNDNEWHLASYIMTDDSTNGNAFAIDFVNAQVDGPVELKELMKINLTEIYGAGNEPNKATCDATFTTYKTGLIG